MLLPIHPQPQEGEILSSWMVRLAYANGFKLHTFYATLLAYKGPIWNRDIDRDPPLALLEVLSRHTGQSVDVLNSMTLRSYAGVLFESLSAGNTNWLLPLGIYHRARKRPGMQYCPICLQQFEKPYFRRCWRLAFYVVCEVHQCALLNQCQRCSMPIEFHRNGIGRKPPLLFDAMSICFGCGFDLRRARPHFVKWPEVSSWERLLRLNSLTEQNGWDFGGVSLPCPLPFFWGLRNLVTIVFGRYGRELREAIDGALQMSEYTNIRFRSGTGYELLEAMQRLRAMLVVCWLLEGWPERFIEIAAGRLPAPSQARVDQGFLAFWVERVFDANALS